jgi:hypothetical protein
MRRRTGFAVAGWLLAALAATGTGLAAVQVIGAGLTGPAGQTRSPDEVARALAASTSPGADGPTPSTGSTGAGPGTGMRELLSTPGGTVVAECAGRTVWLASWTPAQGYRVGDVERGPDDDAEVTFHGSGERIEVEIECPAGRPVPTWKKNDD